MDYLDTCLGYREFKNKGFKEEWGDKYIERRRQKIENVRFPLEKITALFKPDNYKDILVFFEQSRKLNGDVYKDVWVFDRDLTDLQFLKFFKEFNQEERLGKGKYYFDNIVKNDEWKKSRFDGSEQFLHVFSSKDFQQNVRFALEKKDDYDFKVYWQYDDSGYKRVYGVKEFKDIYAEDFKNYIFKRMDDSLYCEWLYKSGMLENMMEKEIDRDLNIEKYERENERKGLECYGYKEYGDPVKGKLTVPAREMEGGLEKEVYRTETLNDLYVLKRKGEGAGEKWLFKRDFSDGEAAEFVRQFDIWKRNENEKKREKGIKR